MCGALWYIVPCMLYVRHMERPEQLVQLYDEEITAQFKQAVVFEVIDR